jgi:hypothetical protein
LLLTAFSVKLTAQILPPMANPSLSIGSPDYKVIRVMAALPDGSIVIGGHFTTINGLSRTNIAKLASDGTLDANWNPAADGEVVALAADANGKVFVGGSFQNIGGANHPFLAKLSGSGAGILDTSWNPSANNPSVGALAVDASGNVYASPGLNIAKLSGGTGEADASWTPQAPNSSVDSIAIDTDGSVYIIGGFTMIGTQNRNHLAKLSSSGTLDASWNPAADNWVYSLALDASGHVYVGGAFANIGGKARNYVAKLSGSGTGTADANWNPSASYQVRALAVDANDRNVYVGGYFSTIGGQTRNGVAKLRTTGTGATDHYWNPNPKGSVLVGGLATAASGNVFVSGGSGDGFTIIGGQARDDIAAFDQIFADGVESN